MANPTLKTVERKTTVPRSKVREAIAVAISNDKINSQPFERSSKGNVKSHRAIKKK